MSRTILGLRGFLILSVIFDLPLLSQELPAPFLIIPSPKQVKVTGANGLPATALNAVMLKGTVKRPVMGNLLSVLPETHIDKKGALQLEIDTSLSLPSNEGYILTIRQSGVTIKAKDHAGLFYGCQTLEQMLEDALEYNKPLPACEITDYPVLAYRAVHFDVKHHLDHMNYYYESIDRLARYKINAVVFEFEDKLRYQRQPLVGAPQAISIDEMAALTRYARERNIEITPLVQGLGHATFILKHEAYVPLRELSWNKWAFCPLNEGTYQVLFDLYRDAIDATPGSKYLHIGGDEIGNIGLCPRCKPMADKEGMLSLSLYWLKRVCEFAAENGRIPVFWDDMPLKEAGVYETTYDDGITESDARQRWEKGMPAMDSLLEDFPKNCVYMRWNYSMARQPGNIMALDWYKSRGLNTMIATATNTEGGELFQQDIRDKGAESAGIVSIKSFIDLAAQKDVKGMLCTAWDDKSPHMENYWRGFIAAAEYSWSPGGRTLEKFDEAWLRREFGLTVPDYLLFHQKLREGSEFWYEALYKQGNMLDEDNKLQSLTRVEHWLPPLAGQENVVFDYSQKLIELPDPNAPGAWSKKYSDRLSIAGKLVNEYPENIRRLQALLDASLRNSYYWELAIALYEFQMNTPRLMVALEKMDQGQSNGRDEVKLAIDDFDKRWNNLKQVYSKTRFVEYPQNYVPDRYFHLASQREDLSWMIQAQELLMPYIKKLIDMN
ncbi:MAG TPA: family 20 glycosylhydrolase [Bacteroidales bacterium]|nr:family 20 glycosylhydrolase [Bacteroidales bacterium]